MAGISSASGSSQSQVAGTNVPPVSFPGIASGIDYNSIIQKLTNLTLLPVQQYNQQITQINARNSELIKINGLLTSVQNSLNALSNPATFGAFGASSSDSTVVTATSSGTGAAAPGSYIVTGTQLATASSVTGAPSASTGHRMTDTIVHDTLNPANDGQTGDQVPLAESFAALSPANGGNQRGQVTVDGQIITYDVASDSLQTIVARINTAVAAVDPGFTASYNAATDSVTFNSTDRPVSLGSPSDRGNLLSVLKLDVAQVNNAASSGSVTSAGPIGGINQATTLGGNNFAGLVTPLTGGDGSFFTINGVHITINPSTDNLAGVLKRINASAAGVTAAFDPVSNQVKLTAKTTGPLGIVIGGSATGDSSNFLDAAGLTAAAGATQSVGQQAKATLQNPNGTTSTYFANTNTIATAIPGMNLNIFQTSALSTTITVTQDSSVAVAAISTFASAYNAAINEINAATAAPVIQQNNSQNSASSTTATSQALTSGGALFGDFSIESIKDRLINLAQSIVHTGSTSYQSLSSIGLTLDNSHQVLQASSAASGTSGNTVQSGPLSISQASGTSGSFMPLDLAKFNAAFSANPNAISSIFTGAAGIVNSFGTYLTTVTGLPTTTTTGLLGKIPSTSFMQSDENANTAHVKSLQDYVQTLTDEANHQADSLRRQFTATEALIAQYQSVQQQIGQLSQSIR
ncbi:MAG: flagellar filament capping protein FliD [Candidatus Velthaea sp.]